MWWLVAGDDDSFLSCAASAGCEVQAAVCGVDEILDYQLKETGAVQGKSVKFHRLTRGKCLAQYSILGYSIPQCYWGMTAAEWVLAVPLLAWGHRSLNTATCTSQLPELKIHLIS